jgi:hypothetical protein
MKKNNFHRITSLIWDKGSYLSTRIDDRKVINTFEYDGYFFDLVYDTEIHEITDVHMDEAFNLNFDANTDIGLYNVNLN